MLLSVQSRFTEIIFVAICNHSSVVSALWALWLHTSQLCNVVLHQYPIALLRCLPVTQCFPVQPYQETTGPCVCNLAQQYLGIIALRWTGRLPVDSPPWQRVMYWVKAGGNITLFNISNQGLGSSCSLSIPFSPAISVPNFFFLRCSNLPFPPPLIFMGPTIITWHSTVVLQWWVYYPLTYAWFY